MKRFRLGLAYLFSAILGAWSGAKAMLDWIGRVGAFQDAGDPKGLTAKALIWLFSTPWWVPGLIAILFGLALLHLMRHADKAASAEPAREGPPRLRARLRRLQRRYGRAPGKGGRPQRAAPGTEGAGITSAVATFPAAKGHIARHTPAADRLKSGSVAKPTRVQSRALRRRLHRQAFAAIGMGFVAVVLTGLSLSHLTHGIGRRAQRDA